MKNKQTNKFSSDQLNDMSGRLAGRAAMQVLSAIQSLPAEQQAAGVSLVFTALCRKFSRRPADLLTVATRMLDEGSKVPANGELRAVVAYVKNQL